jgi:branched-chain amino acid transport system permease protein
MADFGAWRPIITALLIIAVMLAYPTGLAGLIRAGWLAAVGRIRRPAVEAGGAKVRT